MYDIHELEQRLNGRQDSQDATEHLLGLMPDVLTEDEFFAMAQERLPGLEGTWCMIAVDIKHFKLFKELNGQENGETLLIRFAEILHAHAHPGIGLVTNTPAVCQAFFHTKNIGKYIVRPETI